MSDPAGLISAKEREAQEIGLAWQTAQDALSAWKPAELGDYPNSLLSLVVYDYRAGDTGYAQADSRVHAYVLNSLSSSSRSLARATGPDITTALHALAELLRSTTKPGPDQT